MTQVTEVTHKSGCVKLTSLAFLATLSGHCRRRVRPLRSRQGVDTTPEEKPTRAACGRSSKQAIKVRFSPLLGVGIIGHLRRKCQGRKTSRRKSRRRKRPSTRFTAAGNPDRTGVFRIWNLLELRCRNPKIGINPGTKSTIPLGNHGAFIGASERQYERNEEL